MFKILSDKKELAKAEALLEDHFKQKDFVVIKSKIGFKGPEGGTWEDFHWSEKNKIWGVFRVVGSGAERYWNAFGLEKPIEGGVTPSIKCEINVPVDRIDRQIGGAFAINEKEEIILVHRGKIGGGQKGYGKKAFYRYYQGKKIKVEEEGKIVDMAYVGCLVSKDFLQELRNFVEHVAEIKERIKQNRN